METLCTQCGTHVAAPWKFCPQCGAAVERGQGHEAHHPAEKAPVRGAFTGLLFGMLVVPLLVIVGTMLCLTGLGAFLGVPMIAVAVLSPLLGPMLGIGTLHGTCPWCETRIAIMTRSKGFYCHHCSHRIAIENREFVKVE